MTGLLMIVHRIRYADQLHKVGSCADILDRQILSGLYRIRQTSPRDYLSVFPTSAPRDRIKSNLNLVSAPPSVPSAIMASKDGYFVIAVANGGDYLCHEDTACGTTKTDGLDSTKWKLIADPSGAYRIINKGSGQLLTFIDPGGLFCSIATTTAQGQLWNLEAADGVTLPYVPKREMTLPNGALLHADRHSQNLTSNRHLRFRILDARIPYCERRRWVGCICPSSQPTRP